MEKIISNAEIQQTKTYQKLDLGFQILVLKLPSKKAITAGLLIHKTTGVILWHQCLQEDIRDRIWDPIFFQ